VRTSERIRCRERKVAQEDYEREGDVLDGGRGKRRTTDGSSLVLITSWGPDALGLLADMEGRVLLVVLSQGSWPEEDDHEESSIRGPSRTP